MHARIAWVAAVALAAPLGAQTFNGRTATEWVADLGAADATARDVALAALETMGERAVGAARRALDDERANVRRLAAIALGRIGADAALAAERLTALQRDADPAVAAAAKVATLRVQVDAERMPALLDALAGGDWEMQLAAADLLAQLGDAARPAAAALVALLRSDSPDLDRTVVWKVPRARTRYWNVRAAAANALAAIGPVDGVPVADALMQTSTNQEWAAREAAVKALAALPSDATVERVLAVLEGDDAWSCRRAAAEALPRLVPVEGTRMAKAVDAATRALQDADGGVRRLAAEFLGGCGAAAAGAVPELARMLASPGRNPEYATKALRRLGTVGAPAKDALIEYAATFADDEVWRRRPVLEALAAVAPDARREVPALEEMLAAREAPPVPTDVKRQDEIAALLPRLQDADRRVRQDALGGLANLRAVAAIPSLLPWLDDGRPVDERVAAVNALMALDALQAVPRLRELLGADDHGVRHAAAHALAMFGDSQSAARIVEVLSEGLAQASKDELWYLGLTGVEALAPALERIAANTREPMLRRWGATQALGYVGNAASANVVAAMMAAVAADGDLADADRQSLIAVGLRVVASLDAAAHRELFTRHRETDETEVRDAALAGLAQLGDEAAKAAVRARSGADFTLDLDDAWRAKLQGVHLRLSEVRGNTVHDVLARLGKALGVPIVASAKAAPVLDRRVGWMYSELVGYRPDASSVLGLCTSQFFVGTDLVPRFHPERIELVTAEEAAQQQR